VDPGLFDFGPDADRSETAPVAALPPWMRKSAPAPAASAEVPAPAPAPAVESAAAPALPRARRHARVDELEDQSLAAMLSEAEGLAGALAERPPFDPPADVEPRPRTESGSEAPEGLLEEDLLDDAAFDDAAFDDAAFDDADLLDDLDISAVIAAEAELPPAPLPMIRSVTVPIHRSRPATAAPAADPVDEEPAQPAPKSRAGLSRMASVAADAARTSVGKADLARAAAARAAAKAKAKAESAKAEPDVEAAAARAAAKAKAKAEPAKAEPGTTHAARKAETEQRASRRAKPAPGRSRPAREAAPVGQGAPQPTAAPAPAKSVLGKATALTRLRPGRTAISRAGIGAMAIGAIGIAVFGYGAVKGSAPSAAAVPTADNDAVNWLTNNLGTKASVLAPATIDQALGNAHFDLTRVFSYSTATNVPDWHCCNVLVAAGPDSSSARAALPTALQAAYDSSRPMATFDEDGTTVEIRQVLNGTPSAVAAGVQTEHEELVAAGKEIVNSKRFTLSATAKQQLTDGAVDSRVLIALDGIAARHTVTIAAFPNDAASTAAGAPARAVEIIGLDGKALAAGSAAVTDTTNFLNGQVDPYKPLLITVTGAQAASGATVQTMVVAFNAPGQLGLITPTTAPATPTAPAKK
jgi:hypothetical protein